MSNNAFIIRCAPSKISRVDEMVKENNIVIGWSHTEDKLLNPELDRDGFKNILKSYYPGYHDNPRSLGQATGYLWRFFREMKEGDYVLVPTPKAFYIGKIVGGVKFHKECIESDTSLRRKVEWLNEGETILREYCGAGLQSRLKYQGTCVGASEFIEDIERALKLAEQKELPSFKDQLKIELKDKVGKLLQNDSSFLSVDKFEKLVEQVLQGMGAITERPSKTRYGNGIADVDVIASFVNLGIQIYVQVKMHKNETDKHAVEQVVEAIRIDDPEGDNSISGWVVSSADFSNEAISLAQQHNIRLVNVDDLSDMIVSVGTDVLTEI
ncbi:restriction endonuclease [Marinifilum fragile]|uniref:restriction endonuclease n=1 Tax=Marinifilum fragile TaxID=570161 RepID=UPI002AA65287|nr:restriction endonuclease [Marinifilum fragile]